MAQNFSISHQKNIFPFSNKKKYVTISLFVFNLFPACFDLMSYLRTYMQVLTIGCGEASTYASTAKSVNTKKKEEEIKIFVCIHN